MLSLSAIASLGFLLGLRHAFDPDHVIAVSTIVSRQPSLRRALAIGGLWGAGHSLAILALGGALIAFRVSIPEPLGIALELAVAAMLIVLGFLGFRSARLTRRHGHEHTANQPHSETHEHLHAHGEYIHSHPHGHNPAAHGHAESQTPLAAVDGLIGWVRSYWTVRPVVIGVIHGLAGSAAIALLVTASIRSVIPALGYLLIFGLGTIAGMMLVTILLAAPWLIGGGTVARFDRALAGGASMLSIAFGVFMGAQLVATAGWI